jgi:hypothetical protein
MKLEDTITRSFVMLEKTMTMMTQWAVVAVSRLFHLL